jgi:hypothetical protein
MLLTSYTYDQVNHLTQVAMPRNTANGASQFFTDIHKQFGVGTPTYVSDLVDNILPSVAGRLNCPPQH